MSNRPQMSVKLSRSPKVFSVAAVLTVFAISPSSFPLPFKAPSEQVSSGMKVLVKSGQHVTRPATTSDHMDMHHVLAATYYNVERGLNATLMLSNQGHHPMTIHPSLFNREGKRFDAPDNVIPGNTAQAFELRDWIANADETFGFGSLQVSYLGMDMELGGLVKVTDFDHSLIFDEELTEPAMMFASSRLEGVWQLPSPESEVEFALSNTSNSMLSATLMIEGIVPGQREPAILSLGPHEARVLKAEDLIRDRNGTLSDVGGLSVVHSGAPGALLVRGLIRETNKGYSSVVEFSDPATFRSSRLDGAGLRLGKVGAEDLSHLGVARNVGDSRTVLKYRIVYEAPDGSANVISLKTKLNPGEVKALGLNHVIRKRIPSDVQLASLEFTYSTAPGTVIVAAQSISISQNHVFRVPFMDATAISSSTGTYPWSIDDTSSTFVYIKNASNEPQAYVLQIGYGDGAFSNGLSALAPRETKAFDIRTLRAAQVPDDVGKPIPLTANHGQVHWSVHSGQNHVIIGRAEQVDLVNGMSMTAACGDCCPDSFYDCWVDPGSVTGYAGDTTQFSPKQRDVTCYGTPDQIIWPSYNANNVEWSSFDTSVATVDSSGFAMAQSAGGTYIQAAWLVEVWHAVPPDLGFCEVERPIVTPNASCDVLVCAIPNNFHQTAANDVGNGTLRFKYAWGSSTGILGDLSQCSVGERVDYDPADIPWPSPPFPAGHFPPNPTIGNVPATDGAVFDNHTTTGTFVKPYAARSFTAIQVYRYTCPCANGGNPVSLSGFPYSIVRTVSQNANSTWKFTVTKTGSSATIDPLP